MVAKEVSLYKYAYLLYILHTLFYFLYYSPLKEFCREHSEGSQPMPYYETSLEPMDCVFIAFQEIVARPLINDYTVS